MRFRPTGRSWWRISWSATIAVSHPGFADLIDLDKYQVVAYDRCSVQRGPVKASTTQARTRACSRPTRAGKGSTPISGRTSCSTSIPAAATPRRMSSCRSTSTSLHGDLRVLLREEYGGGPAACTMVDLHRSGPAGRHHHRRVGSAWFAIRVLQAGPIDSHRQVQHFQKLVFSALTGSV